MPAYTGPSSPPQRGVGIRNYRPHARHWRFAAQTDRALARASFLAAHMQHGGLTHPGTGAGRTFRQRIAAPSRTIRARKAIAIDGGLPVARIWKYCSESIWSTHCPGPRLRRLQRGVRHWEFHLARRHEGACSKRFQISQQLLQHFRDRVETERNGVGQSSRVPAAGGGRLMMSARASVSDEH